MNKRARIAFSEIPVLAAGVKQTNLVNEQQAFALLHLRRDTRET